MTETWDENNLDYNQAFYDEFNRFDTVKRSLYEHGLTDIEGNLINEKVSAFFNLDVMYGNDTKNISMISFINYDSVEEFKESLLKSVDQMFEKLKKK